MSSHLPASLLILLTTWPDPAPEAGCREKLPEQGKGVLLPKLSGAALQKEGPKSGALGAKGAAGARRHHTDPPGSQAKAAEQVFEQGDLPILPGHRRSWDKLRGPTGAQRLHLSVRSQ